MLLLVSTDHWLHVVPGGALAVTKLEIGGLELDQWQLDVAMYQMIRIDVALLNRPIRSHAAAMRAPAEKLRECLEEGMPWTVLGRLNVYAAIACWVFWGRKWGRG